MHDYKVKTERLLLRPLTVEDSEAVFEWVGDERVARYMCYNTYTNVEDVRKWILSMEDDTQEYLFGLELLSNGKLVGSASIGPDRKAGFWGFGYNLRFDEWGKGYATEAVKAMMMFAHDNFGITKFACSHAEPNSASGNVITKCGLHFVGYGEFEKLDGSCKMRSMEYECEL